MEGADIIGVDIEADTTGAGAGGDFVVIPQLAVGLGALYSVGRASDSIRYWNSYFKNTGRRPKYPFRSGAMDWMKYGAGVGYGYSKLKRL